MLELQAQWLSVSRSAPRSKTKRRPWSCYGPSSTAQSWRRRRVRDTRPANSRYTTDYACFVREWFSLQRVSIAQCNKSEMCQPNHYFHTSISIIDFIIVKKDNCGFFFFNKHPWSYLCNCMHSMSNLMHTQLRQRIHRKAGNFQCFCTKAQSSSLSIGW